MKVATIGSDKSPSGFGAGTMPEGEIVGGSGREGVRMAKAGSAATAHPLRGANQIETWAGAVPTGRSRCALDHLSPRVKGEAPDGATPHWQMMSTQMLFSARDCLWGKEARYFRMRYKLQRYECIFDSGEGCANHRRLDSTNYFVACLRRSHARQNACDTTPAKASRGRSRRQRIGACIKPREERAGCID